MHKTTYIDIEARGFEKYMYFKGVRTMYNFLKIIDNIDKSQGFCQIADIQYIINLTKRSKKTIEIQLLTPQSIQLRIYNNIKQSIYG